MQTTFHAVPIVNFGNSLLDRIKYSPNTVKTFPLALALLLKFYVFGIASKLIFMNLAEGFDAIRNLLVAFEKGVCY